MMTLVHFDEAMIHLMHFSLTISRCNITFLVFWLSQGSVATLIRWGGWSSYCHMCRSFLKLPVKTALKSIDFWQSYRQKSVGSIFMAHSVEQKNWRGIVLLGAGGLNNICIHITDFVMLKHQSVYNHFALEFGYTSRNLLIITGWNTNSANSAAA